MKIFLFISVLSSSLSFAASVAPKPAVYRCLKGNNDSICDQKLRLRYDNNRVSAVSIEYVGDCGSQGPYLYPCLNSRCTDGVIEVTFQTAKSYHWKNLGYEIECDMGL